MSYIDAILHISDLPALLAAHDFRGVDYTPAVTNGAAALTYVRMTPDQAAQWRGTPGVTILAEHPYGPGCPEALMAAIMADAAALALYRAVYDPAPEVGEDGTAVPAPALFGCLA